MATRPRDLKWAALRRWHREERRKWLACGPKCLGKANTSYCNGRADSHTSALAEMTRLVRLTRAASRKGKQTNG